VTFWEIRVFLNVTPCRLVKAPDFSEDNSAFRIKYAMGCIILNILGSFKLSVAIHQLQSIIDYAMSFCVVCTIINIMTFYFMFMVPCIIIYSMK